MEHSRISRIDKLEGASNWPQWQFQITNLLKTEVHDGRSTLSIVNGTTTPPTPPPAGAGEDVLVTYNNDVVKYDKLDVVATTIMTSSDLFNGDDVSISKRYLE